MSYKKANNILPSELIEIIQEYVDGEYIYIPRKEDKRRQWGENTNIKEELKVRDNSIFLDYKNGIKVSRLAEIYFLSEKSIQRIITKMKKTA